MLIDIDATSFLSIEKNIDPAFIEKDWHAVRVLQALSGFSQDHITTIFTGGTSLSKGYGLLQRFSEDLDFRVRFDSAFNPSRQRKIRKAVRESVIECLESIEAITFDPDAILKDGLGFKIQLAYPQQFDVPDGIRPELQVEFSFTQPRMDAEQREISSLISAYKGEPAETSFLCLSPIEIAADKFSSLIWRVIKRDRKSVSDDPAMLRHLHDLAALCDFVNKDQEVFVATALQSFDIDQNSQNRQVGMGLQDAAKQAHQMMQADDFYRLEYEQFVDAMSYAIDAERISFQSALTYFGDMRSMFDV